jgi:hypothetical protein
MIVGLPVDISLRRLVILRVFAGLHIRLRLVDQHIVAHDLRLSSGAMAASN